MKEKSKELAINESNSSVKAANNWKQLPDGSVEFLTNIGVYEFLQDIYLEVQHEKNSKHIEMC